MACTANYPANAHCAEADIMAKLTALPSLAIISGLKGTVDFYLYMDIPVARSWPTSPGKVRSIPVMAQWTPFRIASREWNNLSPEVQASYEQLATNSFLTGRDMQMRAYLEGLYRYPLP